jgi:LTXXQ motif family protein
MRKFTIAAVAVLAIAGSTAVYAQHRAWFHDHMHHARMNPEDRAAMLDARIASVHAGLKLTADQEKLWPVVESAVRDLVKLRFDRANARMNAPGDAQDKDVDPVARLREHADTMAVTADAMKKVADAADPLYKTLDEGQKRRLAALTRPMGRMMAPEGFRHRWMERGDSGREDGPRFGEHRFGPGPTGHPMDRMGWSDDGRESGRL